MRASFTPLVPLVPLVPLLKQACHPFLGD